jgi:hypothetical protein
MRRKSVTHGSVGDTVLEGTLRIALTLVENSLEQRAISLVRNLGAEGHSLRAICRELEKEGYQPIGKRWHPKTISSILKEAA